MIMTDSDYDKLFWFDTPLLLIHLCSHSAIQMDDGKWTGWSWIRICVTRKELSNKPVFYVRIAKTGHK